MTKRTFMARRLKQEKASSKLYWRLVELKKDHSHKMTASELEFMEGLLRFQRKEMLLTTKQRVAGNTLILKVQHREGDE